MNNLIGITGGIGSGKTTLARVLEQRGYAVYFSDIEAKRIIVENPAVRSQIEYLFGSDVFENNCYRTDIVSKAVFRDPTLLHKLNQIVHPAVCFDVHHWAVRQIEVIGNANICFVESALLFESGLSKECQLVVNVTAPESIRIRRTAQRDNISEEEIKARIDTQLTDRDRSSRSDIIINNDGSSNVDTLVDNMLYNIKTALVQYEKKQ